MELYGFSGPSRGLILDCFQQLKNLSTGKGNDCLLSQISELLKNSEYGVDTDEKTDKYFHTLLVVN